MCRTVCSVKGGGAFKASEWGGAICDTMKPADTDVIVQGKRGLCGFASTNLRFILNQNKIENVVLAGFLVSGGG
jgi:ureidoacrylate peracid hydrolase